MNEFTADIGDEGKDAVYALLEKAKSLGLGFDSVKPIELLPNNLVVFLDREVELYYECSINYMKPERTTCFPALLMK